MDEVTDATLCPSCSRCACRQCWDSIFTSSFLCPCCRSDLSRVKLVRCGWFVDLRREVQEFSDEKKRLIELEDFLVSTRSELDDERARLEEEREQHLQEEQVFNAERESFIQEQEQLRKEQEENRQSSELLAVERSIIEEKRNVVDKDIADLLEFKNSDQGGAARANVVFKEVNFLLQQVAKKTELMKCTSRDKSAALANTLKNMTAILNGLTIKLKECEEGLSPDQNGPNAA